MIFWYFWTKDRNLRPKIRWKNFIRHIVNISLNINSKLFSIKRLFHLSTTVKIQFFKTFILPYFDYCMSLFIYFNKQALQKLYNKYYLCLFKLFKVEFSSFSSLNDVNDFLHKNLEFLHSSTAFSPVSLFCLSNY